MQEDLAHDVSSAAAQAILDTVAHLLRLEEHSDARDVWYAVVHASLVAYEARRTTPLSLSASRN